MTPNPLRIVYFIGQLGLGGSEKQLYLILKHMDGACFERHVVVFNPSPNYTLDDDLRRAGVVVHTIPGDCKGILRRMSWLYKLLVTLRPHVVHSWSIHDNAYAGVVGALARVPRRLGSVRGALASPDFQHFPVHIRWLILHSVHGLLVNSEPIAAELRQAGVQSQRIHVLPNCVDTHTTGNVAALPDIPQGARVVGMVGNLRREKNYPLFIRGLAQVLPEFPDLYGILFGQPVMASDPEVPQQLQAEIASQGVTDRVIMGGFCADIPSVLPAFEIFCLTSNSEGTPNAVLEAMAAGLSVIATRVGGISCLVEHGVSGLLVEPGDLDGFTQALRQLLRQPERARAMGLAGRQRVEKEYSCQAKIHQYEAYYLAQFEK